MIWTLKLLTVAAYFARLRWGTQTQITFYHGCHNVSCRRAFKFKWPSMSSPSSTALFLPLRFLLQQLKSGPRAKRSHHFLPAVCTSRLKRKLFTAAADCDTALLCKQQQLCDPRPQLRKHWGDWNITFSQAQVVSHSFTQLRREFTFTAVFQVWQLIVTNWEQNWGF